MSTLDVEFTVLSDALYDVLGQPTRYSDSNKLVYQLIREDIGSKTRDQDLHPDSKQTPYLFLKPEALTTENLEHEAEIQRHSDLFATNHSPDYNFLDDQDGGGLAELEPEKHGSAEADGAEQPTHKDIDRTPRGKRIPLYEALEKYCTNWMNKKEDERPPAPYVMTKIMALLAEIRIDALKVFKEKCLHTELKESHRLNIQPLKEATCLADKYIVDALDTVNISRDNKEETIRGLLCRVFGEELYQEKSQRLINSDIPEDFIRRKHPPRSTPTRRQ